MSWELRDLPAGCVAMFGLVLFFACGGDEDKTIPEESPTKVETLPPPTAPLLASRRVGTHAAFDWLWLLDHPAFIWGPPGRDGGGLLMAELTTMGAASAKDRVLVASSAADERGGKVLEVSAFANADKMAIAWVFEADLRAKSYVMTGDLKGERRSAPKSLGRMFLPPDKDHQRGHIAVTLQRSGMPMVFREIGPKKCAQGVCTQFRLQSVGRGSTRDVPLLVPRPCASPIAGFEIKDDGFQYGVCSGDAPQTTLYSVSFDPEYAEAIPLLSGCTASRFTRSANVGVVSANCGTSRKAVRVQKEPKDTAVGLRCVDGKIWSNATGKHLEPGDRISALLPDGVAPDNARALYTGDAVLVAVPQAINVTIRRYQCFEGRLIRTLTQ